MVQPAFVMLQSSNIEIFLQHKQTERETSPSFSTTLSRFVHCTSCEIKVNSQIFGNHYCDSLE